MKSAEVTGFGQTRAALANSVKHFSGHAAKREHLKSVGQKVIFALKFWIYAFL